MFLQVFPVQKSVLDAIVRQYNEPMHLSVVIIRLRHKSILLITPYLWCSQGCSDDNFVIMQQIKALQAVYKLSVLICGDFNVTVQELRDAGWLEFLKVTPKQGASRCYSYS